MKHLLILIPCLFALDIQACRRATLDSETMCKTQPACQWTSHGCRLNLQQTLNKIQNLEGDSIPPLGTAPLF
jgi:hypothetical protein